MKATAHASKIWLISVFLVISIYLLSLMVAHLSDASSRQLVITRDSARIQDETTESSTWFFNILGVKHGARDLGLKSHPKTISNC